MLTNKLEVLMEIKEKMQGRVINGAVLLVLTEADLQKMIDEEMKKLDQDRSMKGVC